MIVTYAGVSPPDQGFGYPKSLPFLLTSEKTRCLSVNKGMKSTAGTAPGPLDSC